MTITAHPHLSLVPPRSVVFPAPTHAEPVPPCPSWCVIEHEPNEDGEEFLHASSANEITCGRGEVLHWGGSDLPAFIGVELQEGPFYGNGPVIVARYGYDGSVPVMTSGEARALADILNHLADQAERDDETHEASPAQAEFDYAAVLDGALAESMQGATV